jgi:hypothetical protein
MEWACKMCKKNPCEQAENTTRKLLNMQICEKIACESVGAKNVRMQQRTHTLKQASKRARTVIEKYNAMQ